MLLQILDFIRVQKIASDQQLAREFRMELPALQPMLDICLKKGRIELCTQNASCKTACFKCPGNKPVYYQHYADI